MIAGNKRRLIYKRILISTGVVLAGYSFSVRFGGFIGASRIDKAILLVASITILGLLEFLLHRWLSRSIKFRFSKTIRTRLLITNTILAAIFLYLISIPPPFPEAHTLVIKSLDEKNLLSDGRGIKLLAIERTSLPSKNKSRIFSTELKVSGGWMEQPDHSMVWQRDEIGSLIFSSYFQGGISLRFETGPAQGMVKIVWHGKEQIIDLYSQLSAERSIWFPPPLNLKEADSLRRVMVIVAYTGEWLIIAIFLLFLQWLFAACLLQRINTSSVRVMAAGTAALSLCLIYSNVLEKPVELVDPQLEKTVRIALQTFDEPLFKHQLLKIAKLDASGMEITNLDGIELLNNLVELNLRDNKIKDITRLGNLHKLQYLNLRGNQIRDISSLASMPSLRYLNLYSNYHIDSIEPLSHLTNLETLILANVPIRDQGQFLSKLHTLRKLNLRNTKITDLDFISGLNNLEYLNLHTNPELKSITQISNLTNLQTLILQNTPVGSQVGILKNFPKLNRLNLHNAEISDITALKELMDKGILQDNPVKEITASLDIGGNPLNNTDFDAYSAIRLYWNNISHRVPFSLPEFTNLETPIFSHPAGFYSSNFYLGLSSNQPDTTIRYTLDGSEPTQNSPKYIQPLSIDTREGENDLLSDIADISSDWKKPLGEFLHATVVRARLFSNSGDQIGPVRTCTYLVAEDISDRYSIPVISLATDPANFFNDEDGIYVRGKAYENWLLQKQRNVNIKPDANFLRHGDEWERPIHLEFFTTDGIVTFNSDGFVRIYGNSTRAFPQKSLRLTPSSGFRFDGKVITDQNPGEQTNGDSQPIPQLSNFSLHNFGNDWLAALIRDPLMQKLISHTSVNTLPSQPVIVLLNGEYWGIHNMRPRPDEKYLAQLNQVDPEDVVILDDQQVLFRGTPGDEEDFKEILDFIGENDVREESIYSSVKDRIDVDNFIDYQVANIYAANTDWPLSNTKYWRIKDSTNSDSIDRRWRWILYDMDRGFGYDPQYEGYNHRTLEVAENPRRNGFLLSSLLKNDDFQVEFISRFADHLNTTFREDRVNDAINNLESTLQPEMEQQILRWRTMGDSPENWHKNVEELKVFAQHRPGVLRQQILERFGILDTVVFTLQADSQMGFIRVNSIDLVKDWPGVQNPESWNGIYFSGIPVQLTAVPYPGYQFLSWEGTSQETPIITIIPSEDTTITALFSKTK